jgi:hypothetical protein
MTEPAGGAARTRRRGTRARVTSAVAELLAGTGLTIQERRYELVISNPHVPDRGRIYVDYQGGYVSWKRAAWDHWGQLPGFSKEETHEVSRDQITEALGATPASPPVQTNTRPDANQPPS